MTKEADGLLIGWIAELVQRRGLTSAAEYLSESPAEGPEEGG